VLVEGTGASHAEHVDLVDATVWVQADVELARERGLARDVAEGVNGDRAQATAFWDEWMAAELPFLERQQPWRRASVVVHGTPAAPLADGLVEIAAPPTRSTGPRRTPGRLAHPPQQQSRDDMVTQSEENLRTSSAAVRCIGH
jgi:hypothetical protein